QSFLLPRVRVEPREGRPGFYWSLAEAVQHAPAGAVLRLTAGAHYLSRGLRVERGLSLCGAGPGPEGTPVVSDAPDYVLGVTGDGPFVAEEIEFARLGDAPAHVLWAEHAALDLRRCGFRGARRGRQPGDRGGCGLLLTGRATGAVADCTFADNQRCGVEVL